MLDRRGFLGVLIAIPFASLVEAKENKLQLIPTRKLKSRRHFRRPNPHQKELVKSIGEIGLMNPIVVRRNLEVVDGQSRLEACRQLRIKTVPVRMIDISDDQLNYYRRLV